VRLLRSSARMARDMVFVAAMAHGRDGDYSAASVRPHGPKIAVPADGGQMIFCRA